MATDIQLKVFTGRANRKLAQDICACLNLPLGVATIGNFPDGETSVKLEEDVRGKDVFLVQPTCPPVNVNLIELLIVIDAMRRSSAMRVTAVIPYFGYARKDRKDEGRVPITAKLVANLITTAGADRVLAVDLHAAQIQGFFDIPVDHMYAAPVILRYYRSKQIPDLTVVAPDVGGIKIARAYAKALDAGLAVVDKRRLSPDSVAVGYVMGDVKNRNVLMVDDLISTGTTLCEAAMLLKQNGAKDIYVAATHPVFCEAAVQKLDSAPFTEVTVSDSIPLPERAPASVKVVSIAPMLAEAIRRIHTNESVSSLFNL
ncbi:MAG TPA: ribose-phosphate pyrophosphokinase [Planctomycetota bacterium]|nr:ribose-phosphate pyrophosphokinase [Planctomycetota bacterium]